MQFHIVSFEGPDAYSRAGGIASRVTGLASALVGAGFETHLWFIGDPNLPGHECVDGVHLHRWCQWISRYHSGGVYDGEEGKAEDLAHSLPPKLFELLTARLSTEQNAVVLAEEWQTVNAVLHLDWLMKQAGCREQATIMWNANNTFGFHRIPWEQLSRAATITTVSRYMAHCIRPHNVEPIVIPNGLAEDSFEAVDSRAVAALRRPCRGRVLLAKIARFDPDKRWFGAVDTLVDLKRHGGRPLLVARGGAESHGADVLARARSSNLRIVERDLETPGADGLVRALNEAQGADILLVRTHVDAEARRTLFRAADAVLANSAHEPFGLVGLEAMAAGGLACTGCSGEDYAVAGHNAIVLQTDDPGEFGRLYGAIRMNRRLERSLRRAGQITARQFVWPRIVEGGLLPRLGAAPLSSTRRVPLRHSVRIAKREASLDYGRCA